ncbi:MAG: hypothetical protein ACUVUH_03305 [bacterium]
MNILLLVVTVSPFNEANFVSLPYRSISIFSNPAGIGILPGAELFFTYHPQIMTGGVTLGNLGFGISRTEDITNYELGAGYKLPGVFSVGYAHQIGDTTENIIGLIGNLNRYLTLGYRTTLGKKKYMQTGAGIRLFGNILTLVVDMTYEGIDDTTAYYLGCIISPAYGVMINLISDLDWDWHAGIVLGTTKLRLGLMYSSPQRKFATGIIISAQNF